MNIIDLQNQVKEFEVKNFPPNTPSYLALIKAQEELGELSGHYIKRIETRIGAEPVDHQAGVEDSVADIVIALAVFCYREGIDLNNQIEKSWAEVRKRTFVFNAGNPSHAA